MKTPEQIAKEIDEMRYIENYTNSRDIGGSGFRQAIARAAVKADRAQRPTPVVAIRSGEVFEGLDVEVIDLDFLNPDAVTKRSDFDQADIDAMVAKLRANGLTSAADDVIEWWQA